MSAPGTPAAQLERRSLPRPNVTRMEMGLILAALNARADVFDRLAHEAGEHRADDASLMEKTAQEYRALSLRLARDHQP